MTGSVDSSVAAADAAAVEGAWRRLDARMLLVHPVNEVVRFLPALVGVFLVGRSLDDGGWWHLAAVAVPVALGILRYATTTYRIVDGQLQLRRGLVNRKELTARLDRVRTVELTASPIHRLLGLGKVEIGTAGAAAGGRDRLTLDSLSLPRARAMRAALLHRNPGGGEASSPPGPAANGSGTPPPGDGHAAAVGVGREPSDEEILLRLDPGWIRYAPLTMSGLVALAAVAGATSQFSGPLVGRLVDAGVGTGGMPPWLVVVGAATALLVLVSGFALIGYLLNYWRFTVSRDRTGHSFHVTRGLLTSRETSVDSARVRGVEFHEPLGLRLAGAARLGAIVTGMSRREAGVAPMVPPAPRRVSVAVGASILTESEPLVMPLTGHGPQAVRRRYVRAMTASALLMAGWGVAVLRLGWDDWLLVAGVLAPAAAAPLARDRAHRLGHALTPGYLVSRAHCLRGRRTVLARDGIIGWNFRQTFFQRRAGLVTLTATTAAGRQGYPVHDVPESVAVALANEAAPGLLSPFLDRLPEGGRAVRPLGSAGARWPGVASRADAAPGDGTMARS